MDAVTFQGRNGALMGRPWDFIPCGESSKMITELLPELGGLVGDIASIHSMHSKTKTNTPGPACVLLNTGFVLEGFPSAGSWVSYALGSANDNLPTYVAIPEIRGTPAAAPPTGALSTSQRSIKRSCSTLRSRFAIWSGP